MNSSNRNKAVCAKIIISDHYTQGIKLLMNNYFYYLKHGILFLALPDLKKDHLIVKQLNGNPCTMQSFPCRLNCMVSSDSNPRAFWNVMTLHGLLWILCLQFTASGTLWDLVVYFSVHVLSKDCVSYLSKTSFHAMMACMYTWHNFRSLSAGCNDWPPFKQDSIVYRQLIAIVAIFSDVDMGFVSLWSGHPLRIVLFRVSSNLSCPV